jgi:hypothetical protein
MKHKIAFHLARGINFMHFQIKMGNGEIVYVNPNTHSIILRGCTLKNQKAASLKIFNGADKQRCAWVEFDSFEIVPIIETISATNVRFNPRICATWMVNNEGNKDNTTFETLYTSKHNLYQ